MGWPEGDHHNPKHVAVRNVAISNLNVDQVVKTAHNNIYIFN